MDGTIISSEDLWMEASKHMLMKKSNLTENECLQILPQLKGSSLYTSCMFIKMNCNTNESVEELIKEKETFVFKNFKKFIKFIDGFESFHHKLSQLGLKSAIATNATLSSLQKILQLVPLSNFFNEHIYCIDHVSKKPKPEPDVFLHAAEQIKSDPKQCIVIEDSAHGIAAAKAAGMLCIGINTGDDRNALSQADIIIDHYDEINLSKLI